MRTSLATLISFALLGLLSAEEVATRIPKAAELSEINVWTPSGWWLRVRPEGNGLVGFGSSGGDLAIVHTNTFVFTNVYSSLAAAVQTSGDSRNSFSIAFHKTGQRTTYSLYTQKAEVIRPLFEKAKQHCTPTDKQRFEKLWTGITPVPKQ